MTIISLYERGKRQTISQAPSLPSSSPDGRKIIPLPGQYLCVCPTDLLECNESPTHFNIWVRDVEEEPANHGRVDLEPADGMTYSDAALDIRFCPDRSQRGTPTEEEKNYCYNPLRKPGRGCPNDEVARATALFRTYDDVQPTE